MDELHAWLAKSTIAELITLDANLLDVSDWDAVAARSGRRRFRSQRHCECEQSHGGDE